MAGQVSIIRGNALALPIEDSTVDLVVTSPPYFGLRSYQDACTACGGSGQTEWVFDEQCRYVLDGTDDDGTTWFHCQTHDELAPSNDWPCEGARNQPNEETSCATPATTAPTQTATTAPDATPAANGMGSAALPAGTCGEWATTCPECNGSGRAHYDGQIGAEATPAEFVDALIAATREMVRVLKPSGSIWVNLGDKYEGGGGNSGHVGAVGGKGQRTTAYRNARSGAVPTKSLLGIPWRYAIRCIDELGLILRAEVIWSKPNGLPESVTDRVRRSHEQWFHFTLSPRYYSAVDEIREESTYKGGLTWEQRKATGNAYDATGHVGHGSGGMAGNPLGKLPGSVWTIATEPLRVPDHLGIDHFAAFPTEWPRRIITGWSPRGVCVECGAGRRPVSEETGRIVSSSTNPERQALLGGEGNKYPGRTDAGTYLRVKGGPQMGKRERVIAGEACDCPEPTAPTTPGVVLDPFSGTGTTALVADALGRHGIGVDMSSDYCRLAEWRTSDPKQRAKAARKPFTPPAEQVEGQSSLLDLIEEIP